MRISKLVLNFALLTAVASVSATSSASSDCNKRSTAGRNAQTNPPTSSSKYTPNKAVQENKRVMSKVRQGKK